MNRPAVEHLRIAAVPEGQAETIDIVLHYITQEHPSNTAEPKSGRVCLRARRTCGQHLQMVCVLTGQVAVERAADDFDVMVEAAPPGCP